jgi:hypothetical protein
MRRGENISKAGTPIAWKPKEIQDGKFRRTGRWNPIEFTWEELARTWLVQVRLGSG